MTGNAALGDWIRAGKIKLIGSVAATVLKPKGITSRAGVLAQRLRSTRLRSEREMTEAAPESRLTGRSSRRALARAAATCSRLAFTLTGSQRVMASDTGMSLRKVLVKRRESSLWAIRWM